MIISFSGVDCAGKSTQIELLRQYFISIGKSCTVFWYRPGYSQEMQTTKNILRSIKGFSNNLLVKLPRLHSYKYSHIPPKNKKTSQNINVPPSIWLSTALIDTSLQWSIKLRLLEKKYDVVICDRYIHDAYLDLTFKYPSHQWSKHALKALSSIFPTPDYALLLMLPYDEIIRRSKEKNEPFPDDEQTRLKRYQAYESMEKDGLTVINASRDIMEIHKNIVDIVSNK